MIITESFLLWASIILDLIITGACFPVLRKFLVFQSKKSLWSTLFVIFLICFPISEFLLKLPSKTIEVIEYSSSAESYCHKSNRVYGNNIVKTHNGEEISIKGLGMKAGRIYAINLSPCDMLFYPISYTAAEGIFLFNRDKEPTLPKSILLRKEEYVEIDAIPTFWFRKPDKYINTSNGYLKQLWISIFNIEDIKWVVTPYKSE